MLFVCLPFLLLLVLPVDLVSSEVRVNLESVDIMVSSFAITVVLSVSLHRIRKYSKMLV